MCLHKDRQKLLDIKDHCLLHIICGYQCDKAVNKNDTREVMISFH